MADPDGIRRRALSERFLAKFNSESGIYGPIVKRVRSDKDLDLEFRGDYINIYYQGHSILKLDENGGAGINKAFEPEEWPKCLKTASNVEVYLQLLPLIKDKVATKSDSKSRELEFEQLLIRANNLEARNNSDYIILDRQYVTDKRVDRWDLVALRWPIEKRGRPHQEGYLSVIEVKYAQNPDIQDVKSQVERYGHYLEIHLPDICSDMQKVLQQKLDLGLLAKTEGQITRLRKLPIEPKLSETEIIIYLIDYNRNSVLKRRAEETGSPNFRGPVRIVLGGLALWQANLTDFGGNDKQK